MLIISFAENYSLEIRYDINFIEQPYVNSYNQTI